MLTSFVDEGARAAIYGAYLQSAVTFVGIGVALLAGFLAYRGAVAPVKDAVATRRVLERAFAYRLYVVLDIMRKETYRLLRFPETPATTVECQPMPTWIEMDSASCKDQAQLGEDIVKHLIALKAHIDSYNGSVASFTAPSEMVADKAEVTHRTVGGQFAFLDGKLSIIRDVSAEVIAVLEKKYGYFPGAINDADQRERKALAYAVRVRLHDEASERAEKAETAAR